MLSEEESRSIGREYRPRFGSADAFIRSVQRWHEVGGADTAQGLRAWLERDLGRERAATAALSIVTNDHPDLPSGRGETSGCWHCYGRGLVRRDVEPGHPDFGKALLCPACSGGARRCSCARCSGSSSNDHMSCIDEATGHDYDHPEACLRCHEAGVVQVPLPKGIPHADILAGVERPPGVERRRDGEARTP